ncbi:hypothetical protein D3C79_884150 [compost metagenome]
MEMLIEGTCCACCCSLAVNVIPSPWIPASARASAQSSTSLRTASMSACTWWAPTSRTGTMGCGLALMSAAVTSAGNGMLRVAPGRAIASNALIDSGQGTCESVSIHSGTSKVNGTGLSVPISAFTAQGSRR